MEKNKFKRNVAYKLRIGEILIGKPNMKEDKFLFLELGDRKISRVNIVGNIVDKYEGQGKSKYLFFTLDDGSGQIQLKIFSDDVDKFKNIQHGETVLVIGILRYWNNSVYVIPEIIKPKDPKYLLVRKLETEKNRNESGEGKKEEGTAALKDRILEIIKNSEEQGGALTDQIILQLQDVSPESINNEIKALIEEGIIFEPRPGKVRYLG